MKERDSYGQDIDSYWHADYSLGRFVLHGEERPLYLRLHRAEEAYRERRELGLALACPTGERSYVHAKPYLVVPTVDLAVGLSPNPGPDAPVGRVLGSEVKGIRKHDVGQCQAWYYHGDKLLVLWECYFHDPCAGDTAVGNENLLKLWRGFEQILLWQLPRPQRIVTTWEDSYDRADWRAFLEQLGYAQSEPAIFSKSPR